MLKVLVRFLVFPMKWEFLTVVQVSNTSRTTRKKHSESQAQRAKTSMVTPSFYCSFWASYIWLTFVPSLKTIWIVHHFQGNYLNWVKTRVHLAPCKQMLHCWSTTTNIVGMLHVASVCTPCCMLLHVVGSCCTKFETGQQLPTLLARLHVASQKPGDWDLKPEVFQ